MKFPASRRSTAAFTLIELLTVITIILILAGLILGIAGSAQHKAAVSRADGEIHALSVAANNYQIDNGTYPRDTASSATNATDKLDALKYYDPASNGTPTYTAASLVLYQLLGGSYYIVSSGTTSTITLWSSGSGVAQPTVYYPFKDSQLMNSKNVTSGYIDPSTVQAILDPFGFSYGYSTAYQADVDANNATTPPGTTAPTHGYNPTYDLWSTAGYSVTSGKPYPTSGTASSTTNYNTLWVKNW